MAWGAILLAVFLLIGWTSRRSARTPIFPAVIVTTVVLAVVYVNLGKV